MGGPKLVMVERPVNNDALALAEGTLARIKAGECIGVAIVEVLTQGVVASAWSAGDHYHQLNSGCARLASRVAMDTD